jgi:hypothetical protein
MITKDPTPPVEPPSDFDALMEHHKATEQAHEARRVRAYRAMRIFEPSMEGYAAAVAVYEAAFGKAGQEEGRRIFAAEQERMARNLLDAKYLNPECAENGCQFLRAVVSEPPKGEQK